MKIDYETCTIPGFFENYKVEGNEIKEPWRKGKTVYIYKNGELKEPGFFGKTVLVFKRGAVYEPGFLGRKLFDIQPDGCLKEPKLFGKNVGCLPVSWLSDNDEGNNEKVLFNTSANQQVVSFEAPELREEKTTRRRAEIEYVADVTNTKEGAINLKIPKKYNVLLAVAPALDFKTITVHERVIRIKTKSINCSDAFIVDEMNEHYSSENGILYNKGKSVLLKVPYDIDPNNLKINTNTRVIDSYSFSGIDVERMIIPMGVERIATEAFFYCKIKYIYLPKTCKEIDENAFDHCGKLVLETEWKKPPKGWKIDLSAFKEVNWKVKREE